MISWYQAILFNKRAKYESENSMAPHTLVHICNYAYWRQKGPNSRRSLRYFEYMVFPTAHTIFILEEKIFRKLV